MKYNHKQKQEIIIVILLNIFFITACSSQNIKDKQGFSGHADSDTFIREVPLESTGEPEFMYRYIREWEKDNRLPNIVNGSDSIEIRVWYHNILGDTLQLLRIVHEQEHWGAKGYNLWLDTAIWRADTSSLEAYKSKSVDLVPKSGWNNLISKVFSLGIKTLPTDNQLKKYKCEQYINYLHFEVATNHSYRLFSYCELSKNSNKFPEAKRAMEIIQLLQKELDFKPIKAL